MKTQPPLPFAGNEAREYDVVPQVAWTAPTLEAASAGLQRTDAIDVGRIGAIVIRIRRADGRYTAFGGVSDTFVSDDLEVTYAYALAMLRVAAR